MSLPLFEHVSVETLEEAQSRLKETKRKAVVTAGGTDLLGVLENRIHTDDPEVVVNLKNIPDLNYIREDDGGVKIGCLARLHDIERHPLIREKYPVLAEAVRSVASPQIRNMATIGGNLCQETRCWYYRNPDNMFHCIRKGGKACNAFSGENRYHSVFGALRVANTPCTDKCPAGTDIPSYMSRIREGDFRGAAELILKVNPMPALTGRVCPHFCQEACNRGDFDEPVSVRNVERYLGDMILKNPAEYMKAPEMESGKRVAIVGSGPAGLSAAYYLRKAGHGVSVFEKSGEPGGMLAHAIPSYRLPKEIVRQVVQAVVEMGVELKTGVHVGKDLFLEELRKNFDSLFLATGAWAAPAIGIEGEKLALSGLAFLTRTEAYKDSIKGSHVVVVGGGNVAVDAGVTAVRMGAAKVTLVCLETREEMPALDWEIEQALEEGVSLQPSWGPVGILHKNEKISGVELVRCTSVFDEAGNFTPVFDGSVRKTLDADTVILAVGQKPDLSYIGPGMELGTAGGLVRVEQATQAAGIEGVFSGGDMTNGPGTVIEAVAAGRRAAISMDRFLAKNDDKVEKNRVTDSELLSFSPESLKKSKRTRLPKNKDAPKALDVEDTLGMGQEDTTFEATRCFNCGCVAVNPSDAAPALIALDAKVRTTRRMIEAEKFFAAAPRRSTVLDHDELITEIVIPAPRSGSTQVFFKFRLRKAIDFPIAGLAAIYVLSGGVMEEARIVMSAVAPIPLRFEKIETYLIGKAPSVEVADRAAEMVASEAIPLAGNIYKVQIVKALVKRSILLAGRQK